MKKQRKPSSDVLPSTRERLDTDVRMPTARSRYCGRLLFACVVLLGLVGTLGLLLGPYRRVKPSGPVQKIALKAVAKPPTFVGDAECASCHKKAAEAWRGSHHALAMTEPTAATVRGDFANAKFTHRGKTTIFSKRGDRYFVQTEGPDGKSQDFAVKYTFGIEPLQQYLIELTNGRLQNLTIAWDVVRKRWFHLYPNEHTPPGDVLHWTGRYQNANMMCLSCHTTGYKKNYDARADAYTSRWSQGNVGCEACHGPASLHVKWAKNVGNGGAKDLAHFGFLLDFRTGGQRAELDVCAMCHSRRSELSSDGIAGKPLMDHYLPALLTEGLYHADGQQQDEVYVDGSFRESKMFGAGVRCSDCHDAHSGKTKASGNALCTQCHSPMGDKRFISAAKLYDDPKHHFHRTGSAGAQCVNCHMPSKNYMIVDDRRDHSLRIPRPDLSVSIGTPNACSDCHVKEGAAWAAEAIKRWYGPRKPHFGEVFASARAGNPAAEARVVEWLRDKKQPAIVRASALELLAESSDTSLAVTIEATRDEDASVRRAAVAAMERAPQEARIGPVAPLLKDPIRAVRIEAARVLSSLPEALLSPEQARTLDHALVEFRSVQEVGLDMPGAHLNLAVAYENRKQSKEAESQYLEALRLDPDFAPARLNLSRLYNAEGRNKDAIAVLSTGLDREKSQGQLWYSLALLLAEEKRMPEAIKAFAEATRWLPNHARAHYNYGLALQQIGKPKEAEHELLLANKNNVNDAEVVYALAILYAQNNQISEAIKWAERYATARPQDPNGQKLLAQLKMGRE